MNCPHCGYEHQTWDQHSESHHKNPEGDFFQLPVQAERDYPNFSYTKEQRNVYGCPKCLKLFMEGF